MGLVLRASAPYRLTIRVLPIAYLDHEHDETLVDDFVDDRVVTYLDPTILEDAPCLSIGTYVEADHDGVRGDREIRIRFVDAANPGGVQLLVSQALVAWRVVPSQSGALNVVETAIQALWVSTRFLHVAMAKGDHMRCVNLIVVYNLPNSRG